jgi:hypothetical protein
MELRGERVPTALADIGEFRVVFEIVNSREIQVEWQTYLVERQTFAEEQQRSTAAERERLDRVECERRDAIDRITACWTSSGAGNQTTASMTST